MTMPVGGNGNQQAMVTVNANVDPFTKSMGAASKAAAAFGNVLKDVDDAIFKITKRAGIGLVGGGLLAAFGDIKDLQKAADFQKSMSGLAVQSGLTGRALDDMGNKLKNMGQSIPLATSNLIQLAQVVASVGVKGTANITQMTAAAAKLAAATNTAPGQLFTGLASLNQTMGNSLQTIERYGSVLTKLQQNMGVDAQGTLDFSASIEAVGQKAGIGEASIIGLSAAFQKLGIDSTSGAQAFNQVVNDMSDAVSQGSSRIALFASTMGMSVDSFKKLFHDNPAAAFTGFVNSIAAQGQRANDILGQFGLDSVRTLRVFAALSSGQANLAGALQQANAAYTQNTALAQSASQAWDTLSSDTTRLGNAFTGLQETIGRPFVGAMDFAVTSMSKLTTVIGNAATYLNSINIPILGDSASGWVEKAAGVGILAGAFGILFASIYKTLGVWRLLSGALGGSAIRGFGQAMTGGWLSGGRGSVFMKDPELRPGMSRTQLVMYRAGYDAGNALRRGGTGVDPNLSPGSINRNGLVGAAAMFPFTRMRQMWNQTWDTALHPWNAANRDPNKTDPFSMYGGYQQLQRLGGRGREAMVAHLTRDGASAWEQEVGGRLQRGFGNPDTSATRLRTERWAFQRTASNHAYQGQYEALRNMSAAERQILLQGIWVDQNPELAAKRIPPPDYNRLGKRSLDRIMRNASTHVAQQTFHAAGEAFDEKVPDAEQSKLANPFRQLAEKVKEITKTLLTDTNATIQSLLDALKGYYAQASSYVTKLAQQMKGAVQGVNVMPSPGSPGGPAAPGGPVGPIGTTPGRMYGPPPPPRTVPASAAYPLATNGYGGLDPVQFGTGGVIRPPRAFDIGQLSGESGRPVNANGMVGGHGEFVSDNAWKTLVGKSETLEKATVIASTALKATGNAALEAAKSLGNMALGFVKNGWLLQLAIWGPMAAMGIQELGSMLEHNVAPGLHGGQEMIQAMGGSYTSAYDLNKQRTDAQKNRADQTPWGPNEVKDSQSTGFAASHTSVLSMLAAASGNPQLQKSIIQDQVNRLLQQSQSGTLNAQGQGQIRETLIAALGPTRAGQIYNNLNWNGQPTDLIGNASRQIPGASDFWGAYSGKGGMLNDAIGASAADDSFLNGNQNSTVRALLEAQVRGKSEGGASGFMDKFLLPKGSAAFQNQFSAILDAMNAQLPDGQKIKPGNDVFGQDWMRKFSQPTDMNTALDMLHKKGDLFTGDANPAANALYHELIASMKAAGIQFDSMNHMLDSTTVALAKMSAVVNKVADAVTQLTPQQLALQGLPANEIYRKMSGQPDGYIGGMLSNTNSATFPLDMYRLNQELMKPNAGKNAPNAATDVSITSNQWLPGLNQAITELVKTMDALQSGPGAKDWQALNAQLQTDIQLQQSTAAMRMTPAETLNNQSGLLTSISHVATSPDDTSLITGQIAQIQQAASQELQVLQQAHDQIIQLQRQQARETADYYHQLDIMARDHNIQVAEANYQYNLQVKEANYQRGVQQREALYQYQLSQTEQLYSFDQTIRQMHYSLAQSLGTPGTLVQAQYTESAQSALAGFAQQTADMQKAKDGLNQLQQMGVSNDAIRVFGLDQPQNFAQVQRYLTDFIANPSLVKAFNDAVAKNLNITQAIATNPGNSQYADLKLNFDHEAKVASDAFAHAQQLSAEAFDHSMKLSSDSFGHSMQMQATQYANSLGDYAYSFNLSMKRQTEDLSHMLESLTMTPQQLIDWAHKVGIPGLNDVANAVTNAATAIQVANAALEALRQQQLTDAITAQNGNISPQGNANSTDQRNLLYSGAPTATPGIPTLTDQLPSFLNPNFLGSKNNLVPMGGGQGVTFLDYSSMLGGVAQALGTLGPVTDNTTTAIKNQVTAAGNAAKAQDANKSAAVQNTDSVKAQHDAFLSLTTQLGFIPPGLQALGQHLGVTDKDLGTTTGNVGVLHVGIAGLPDRNVKITAETASAMGAVQAFASFTASVVNDVITNVLNKGLIGAWDYVVSALGLPGNLHVDPFGGSAITNVTRGPVAAGTGMGGGGGVPMFAAGGYTGDGGKYDPAGIVHAGEFVVTQEKTRKFRPLLEAIHQAPSYATGGPVATWPQLDAIRQAMFPGSVLTSAYRPGANDYHGLGEAIDIGVYGNLQSGLMPIAAALASHYPNSTELIHNPNASIKNGIVVPSSFWGAATWAQHANHVHWAMTPQALAGAGGSPQLQAMLDPIAYIVGQLNSVAGNDGPGFSGLNYSMAHGLMNSIPGNLGPRLGSYMGAFTPPSQNYTSTGGSVAAIVQQVAAGHGWGTGPEWSALSQIIQMESSWNPNAQNPTSTAYGLYQFLDSTWGNYGHKTSDPFGQSVAGDAYILARYGDPIKALAFHQAHGWYGNGGVFTGRQTIGVGESGPEAVIPLNSHGQNVMAETMRGALMKMTSNPAFGAELARGRSTQYASPARSEMHYHHTDASTNFTGDITVVAQDPNEMARKLAERSRLQALTRPMARR